MQEVFNFLKKVKVNFVATVATGSKPNLRPFGDPVLFDGKIYCLTSKDKTVYQEITANNEVCIVAMADDEDHWIRIRGKLVDDSNNIEAKKAIIAEFDWAQAAGYTLDNPDFACLYLAEVTATIANAEGEVSAEYNF